MAFHILWVGSKFPEVLDEMPAAGYALSEKLPAYSLLKSLSDMPEKMMQEELVEYPDFLADGQKGRPCPAPVGLVSADVIIPFEEQKLPPFHPDGHHPPPRA